MSQFEEEQQIRQLFAFALATVIPIGTLAFGIIQCKGKKKPEGGAPGAAAAAAGAKPGDPSKSKLGAAPGAPPAAPAAAAAAPAGTPIPAAPAPAGDGKSKVDEPKVG